MRLWGFAVRRAVGDGVVNGGRMRLWGFAVRRAVGDWRRSVLMFAGVVVAVASFVVLTGNVETATLATTATVNANARSSYDILVRPAGSQTALETAQQIVRPNYLSGIYGGITTGQVDQVRAVTGVQVAAPIAMVGQVLQTVSYPVDLSSYVPASGPALLRFSTKMSSRNGSSTVAGPAGYVYVTDRPLAWDPVSGGPGEPYGARDPALPGRMCMTLPQDATFTSPFEARAQWQTSCWSRTQGDPNSSWSSLGPGRYPAMIRWSFPVTLAAIDPAAEAALTGVDTSMVEGRFLTGADGPVRLTGQQEGSVQVPVIASSRPDVDESMSVTIEQVPAAAVPAAVTTAAAGDSLDSGRTAVLAAPVDPAGTVSVDAATVLHEWTRSLAASPRVVDGYWTGDPVTYTGQRQSAATVLTPQVVTNPDSIWASGFQGQGGYVAVPPAAAGTSFRHLNGHPAVSTATTAGQLQVAQLKLIGSFDPARLPNYSPLSQVPLETYRAPQAQAGDAATAAVLGGQPLRPDLNPAGYLQSPPYLLTTLASVPAFTSPGAFTGAATANAPVSVIRVRVADVTGSDPVSREKVRLVAESITKATGLDVDITIGSSPAPQLVNLPPSTPGSPALLVKESWVKKGVVAVITAAIDRKSLLLFLLVLAASALSVAITANATVRARRTELAVLSCLGWRRRAIFTSVTVELVTLGLVAGIVGAALALPSAYLLGVEYPLPRALLAVPAAVGLCFLAGLAPAVTAARTAPLDAVTSPVSTGRWHRPARTVTAIAAASVLRRPGRALAAAAAIALGAASLTVMLGVLTAFNGAVVGTLLGDAVSLQVRTPDIVAAALIALLGLAALADVMLLDAREQAPVYAVLQASGWTHRTINRLVTTQAALIGLCGAAAGVGAGLLAVAHLGPLTASTYLLGAAIAAGALGCACATALLPAHHLRRQPTAAVLSQE